MFYTNVYQNYDKIYIRGYTDAGKKFHEVIDYEPYLFVLDQRGEYRTIDGKSAKKITFDSCKKAREFLKLHQGTNVDVYGFDQFPFVLLNDYFPGELKYDTTLLSIVSWDIEVSSRGGFADPKIADKEITAISLVKGDEIRVFGYKAYNGKYKSSFIMCKDEADMLLRFLDLWEEWDPDIVTGWNIDGYDIPYVINRLARLFGEKTVARLSPYRKVTSREITRGKSVVNTSSKQETIYEIAGIASLDYFALYRKFTSSGKESYALNHIAFVELGEKKVDYSEYGSLDNLYDLNYDLFIDYNVHDSWLVSRIERRLNYIMQCVAIAYRAKVNYVDALTTTRPWDAIIHNYLMDRKIVIPPSKASESRDLIGAYVKDPIVGMHHYIVSLDFTSEYPSIMSQLNISPETFVKRIPLTYVPGTIDGHPIKEGDVALTKVYDIEGVLRDFSFGLAGEEARRLNCTIAMNGCLYTKEKRGFIPELIDGFMAERKILKNKSLDLQKLDNYNKDEVSHLDNMAQAIKILMNGLYGALSNLHFRYFDINPAESVTTTGQLAIRWNELSTNRYFNKVMKTEGVDYVIYSDTDSIYVDFMPLIRKLDVPDEKRIDFIADSCKKILEPHLADCNAKLAELTNAYKPVLKINREMICDKAIWRGKKMYILHIWDKEGIRYKEPQIKTKGMETVRSSTPMVCRDKLKECIKIILEKDEKTLQQYVKEFEKEFYKLTPYDIAFPRSVDDLAEYFDPVRIYKSGTPIQVRAAITYNQYLKNNGLIGQIPEIKSGEKIKYVYLKEPNPFHSHTIAVSEGMSVREWTDYETQWEKAFLGPLQSITNLIKWRTEAGGTTLSFFKPKKKD